MAGEDRSIVSLANPAVQSCWLCGTRLPAREMVADGGPACADLRWYCADTRRCTERWTSRWSTGVGGGHGRGGNGLSGNGLSGNGHAGHGSAFQGPVAQGPLAPGLAAQEHGVQEHSTQEHSTQGHGTQGRGAVPGQGSSALPVRGRGTVPDPRGRQLAGLSDQ